ncbi:MAG TPA: hypothetical protein VKQ52_06080, partial [Puia sp.]|nr:hypothetical protein [Puia sp.]
MQPIERPAVPPRKTAAGYSGRFIHTISILAFLLLSPPANAQLTPRPNAQLTPRHLLEKQIDLAGMQKVLFSKAAWKPFPRSAAEWEKILPDSIRAVLIRNGEACLQGSFPNVPASVTLDFFRNGNRTRYESIAFGKRNRLWALVLAESVEGRGRFLDAILDGIWSISEETFWGASAHLFLQKGGKGLPDAENPV